MGRNPFINDFLRALLTILIKEKYGFWWNYPILDFNTNSANDTLAWEVVDLAINTGFPTKVQTYSSADADWEIGPKRE